MRLLICLLIFPLNGFSQSWTLNQCIDSAVQNNLTLKKSALQSQISAVTLQTSRQNVLPSLNANASHGYNWGQTIDPFTNQFATNRVQYDNFYLASSISLFSGLQNYYTVKADMLGSEQTQLEFAIARRNLKMDITAAFLQILLNKSILELAEGNLSKTKQQLLRITELQAVNQATTYELSEIKAQISLDEFMVTKSKNDVNYSKLLLQQLMFVKPSGSFEPDSVTGLQNITIPEKPGDSAIADFPDVQVAQLGADRQFMLLKQTRGKLYPSLVLSGSIGSGYSGNNKSLQPDGSYALTPLRNQLNENFYQSVQMSLSIPIFNKNAIRNQVRIAEYQLESLYLDVDNQFSQLKQKIEQLSMDIANERIQYDALQKVREAAFMNYQNFTIRYENGDVSFTELTEIKNKLLDAESKLLQSEYQLKLKSMLMSFYQEN